jgi:co-chaperonin GroES (HSP10)
MNNTIATPDKKIVSISGDPIITKNTTTKEGVKLTEDEAIARTAAQLPDVKGYRILCIVPEADEAYERGIIKSDAARQILEEHSTVVLWVMQLGDLAYKDKARFPEGPWCKEGDFVITRAYAGTRIKIHGKEFRIINDDTVEAVVDDPRGYERA